MASLKNSSLEIKWGDETIIDDKIACRTSNDVVRVLAKQFSPDLYGTTAVETTEVDHWLTFSLNLSNSSTPINVSLNYLNNTLAPVTYLSQKRLTVADFCVFASLYANNRWNELLSSNNAPTHVLRWYNFIKSQKAVKQTIESLPDEVKSTLIGAQKVLASHWKD